MNYLLDKKIKRKKFSKIILAVFVLLFLFFFRASIFNGFSFVAEVVFRPVLFLGRNTGEEISNLGAIFHSRKSLLLENENLKSQMLESQTDRANYASVVDENNQMKEILGRKDLNVNMVLAGILAKPNRSPYDTLLIDAGIGQGIISGQRVFALGHSPTGEVSGSVPIGSVAEAYSNSSKVILFSNPGEKTEVIITGKNISLQAVGRGGGNFEIILPRDFVLDIGTQVVLLGINAYVLGTVQNIISDPRDAFQKALLSSPVNIQELKFVEIEK